MLSRDQTMDILLLHKQGHSIRRIARDSGHSRNTVRRTVREGAPRRFQTPQRPSKLDPFKDYLRERFQEHGLSGVRLTQEIRKMGFEGSERIVCRFLATLRVRRPSQLTVRFETPPGEQHRLFFLSAMEMARRLGAAFKENRLPHAMKALTQPRLLIIDEVGYLGLDQAGAAMLFQIICNRYEKNAATIITSNKPFAEWAHIFAGDPVMASAALDRLLHRATIINIKGESYRLKDKRKAGLFHSLQHKPEKPPKS